MQLSPTELAVLAAVHRADEEEGGLPLDDLDEDETAAFVKLETASLVETRRDEEHAWGRVTWRGVETLRDAALREGK